MATNFPTSLDSLTNPATTDQLNSPSHAAQHENANDAIEQLQAKVGVNSSAVTTSHDYKIAQLEAAITSGISGTKLIYQDVRNQSGSSLIIGTPVRVTGSDGASGKLLVAAASNASEAGSSKTFGLVSSTISNNSNGQVITNGLVEGLDTTGAADGDPVWLGVNGAKIFGLINKPVAPAHLVYLGVVVRGGQQNTGSIFVAVQNGFEVEELHNVLITQIQNKDALVYDSTTQLWKNYDLSNDFVLSGDLQNSLGDYIPLNALGQPSGPATLDADGNLIVPENKIIIEGATADAHELTLQAPDVVSDITVTLPNAAGTLALTSDITTAVNNLVNSAPNTLDTLNELATALGNDANFATTTATSIGNKVSKAGGDVITSSTASTVPLVLKGAPSQTANLQQWQNSAGAVQASIASNGAIQAGTYNGVLVSLNYPGIVVDTTNADSTQVWLRNLSATSKSGRFVGIKARNGYADAVAGDDLVTLAGQQYVNALGYESGKIVISNDDSTPSLTSNPARITFHTTAIGSTTLTERMRISNSGNVLINGFTAPTVGLTVKAAASQTADLQQWQDSAGNILSRISPNGLVNTSAILSKNNYSSYFSFADNQPIFANPLTAAHVALVVKGAPSQTSNLQEWQNSSGTILASVDSTGAMFTITPAANTNTTQVATTAYVQTELADLVNSAPATLDTLNELATALGNDANFSTTVTNSIALKAPLASPALTGTPTAPTAAVGTDTTQIATTAFVIDQIDASTQPGALYQTTAPTSPEIGQIWIDSDENVTTFDSNIIRRKTVTATAGQTVFTTDVPFIDGFEQVFMNGLLLVKTTDYATSNSNTVTLTSGAAVSDIIEIVTVTGASSVSTYTQAETDALLAANTSVAPLSISANTTLVAKKRYFVTSASALTLTLPATPALNDEIQILDASGNASTYNITVARNGNKINGGTGNLIIDNNGGWYTLLYTGSTYGWKVG